MKTYERIAANREHIAGEIEKAAWVGAVLKGGLRLAKGLTKKVGKAPMKSLGVLGGTAEIAGASGDAVARNRQMKSMARQTGPLGNVRPF